MRWSLLVTVAALLLAPAAQASPPLHLERAAVEAAREAGVDPWLVRALAQHEARWLPAAVNPHNGCVGLMQLCPWTLTACKVDVHATACVDVLEALKDGPLNLRVGSRRLAEWTQLCRARTGHAELHHVLAGFAGADLVQRATCGQRRDRRGRWRDVKPHQVVVDVLQIRRRLLAHRGAP